MGNPYDLVAARKNAQKRISATGAITVTIGTLREKDARIAQLTAELAEARLDSERLDWFIRNNEDVNIDGWYDHADVDALDKDEDGETLKAWRKYLDAAIRAVRGAK